MSTVPLRTSGAASPTRTRRCNKGLSSAALLLGLQLVASVPPAWADLDVNRLVFEAGLLTANPAPVPAASPSPSPALASIPDITTAPAAPAGSVLAQITAHTQRIAALEETEGAFSPQLVQEYLDLGQRYQSLGRHDAAIEAFEDAEHLNRISAGLVNPALLAIIEASLPSHLARGELQELGRKQQTLYELTRELHGNGSDELVPMLARLGDWQVTSFRRSLQRQPVVSITFGGSGRSMDPRQAGFGNLMRAQRHYSEAISNLLQRQDLHSTDLLPLEQKFVQTLYLEANRIGLLEDPNFYLNGKRSNTGSRVQYSAMQGIPPSYINGRSAYERMRWYARARQEPLEEQAALLIAEADWHLLFRHHGRARALYQEAWEQLQKDGVSSAKREALLTPPLPQQLPEFMALPHSRGHFGLAADTPLQWQGWIDVSFEVSRYGKPQRLTLLDSSEGTDKAVQARLRRLLMASPFRPHIGPEGPEAAAHVYRLRYHYALAENLAASSDAGQP